MSSLSEKILDLEYASKTYLKQVEAAFTLMNKCASGEHLKQWSRVDPQAVLGEVYFILAIGFNQFKEVVERGEPKEKAVDDE